MPLLFNSLSPSPSRSSINKSLTSSYDFNFAISRCSALRIHKISSSILSLCSLFYKNQITYHGRHQQILRIVSLQKRCLRCNSLYNDKDNSPTACSFHGHANVFAVDCLFVLEPRVSLETVLKREQRLFIRCGAKQSGDLDSSDQALDGILGFGQSNTSLLSQLASAKKKIELLMNRSTKSVKIELKKSSFGSVRYIWTHFNIALDSIDVNGDAVKLPTSIFDFVKKQAAIVDSGTTLAYFPDDVYYQLMEKIKAAQPDNKPHTIEKLFTCYKYSGKFCIISIGLDDLEFVTQRSKESHVSNKTLF
ncbi:hypothetical protein QVD17_42021 [Tagetes erecta]|uniref:Xylanase inhibitor C-terminal domain-containing protein n=1 Tax=Tagetes erecta TaxID=13708 RepID=A0AAD8JMP3_TARER|nr:hypothetical protein QVD17_42021 [Tagetes erecta]